MCVCVCGGGGGGGGRVIQAMFTQYKNCLFAHSAINTIRIWNQLQLMLGVVCHYLDLISMHIN